AIERANHGAQCQAGDCNEESDDAHDSLRAAPCWVDSLAERRSDPPQKRALDKPWADSVCLFHRHGVADALAQLLAGLEVGNVLARERHRLPGLGIAPHPWRPVMQ